MVVSGQSQAWTVSRVLMMKSIIMSRQIPSYLELSLLQNESPQPLPNARITEILTLDTILLVLRTKEKMPQGYQCDEHNEAAKLQVHSASCERV